MWPDGKPIFDKRKRSKTLPSKMFYFTSINSYELRGTQNVLSIIAHTSTYKYVFSYIFRLSAVQYSTRASVLVQYSMGCSVQWAERCSAPAPALPCCGRRWGPPVSSSYNWWCYICRSRRRRRNRCCHRQENPMMLWHARGYYTPPAGFRREWGGYEHTDKVLAAV